MIDKEKRFTNTLEKYWSQLRGNRPFPSESEIDPDAIKHVWQSCFLVNVHEGSAEDGYHYAFLGKDLIDAYGDDIAQEEVNILLEPTKKRMAEKIAEVVETGKPVVDEADFINANSVHIKYRKVFLPLGIGGDVQFVIGAMRWRGY